jgi:hypothetical protein
MFQLPPCWRVNHLNSGVLPGVHVAFAENDTMVPTGCGDAGFAPSDTDGQRAGGLTARAAFTRPRSQNVPVPATPSAVSLMRFTTAEALVPHSLVHTSAARPATCGAAIDVPLMRTYPPMKSVDRMPLPPPSEPPGAATSTHVPYVEKLERASFESVLATDSTLAQLAGECRFDVPSLPAATTTTTFRAEA